MKPDAIQPVGRSSKINFLLYGPPGAGKTRMMGSNQRTLIVHPPTDHMDSIRVSGAEEWIVPDWGEMNNVGEFARHDGAKYYDWIWLDSISLFQDAGLDDIWSGVIGQKPHRAEYSLDKGEYGINMWRLQTWVRNMVGLRGFNFGITAHPQELENPITGEMKLQPWVQGKNMSTKIQGYMNVVGYLEVVHQDGKEPRRVLRTWGTEKFEAKDQFDAFPNGRLVDPTMEKFEKAIAKARRSSTNGRPTDKKVARRKTRR